MSFVSGFVLGLELRLGSLGVRGSGLAVSVLHVFRVLDTVRSFGGVWKSLERSLGTDLPLGLLTVGVLGVTGFRILRFWHAGLLAASLREASSVRSSVEASPRGRRSSESQCMQRL